MKKNIKSSLIICGILAICTIVFSTSFASAKENNLLGKSTPNKVVELAKQNLDIIIARTIKNLEEEKNKDLDESKFTLGNAYQLSYISEPIDGNLETKDTFKDLIEEKDEWLYIINYENEPIMYLTIANLEGTYEVVSFGGNAESFNTTLYNYLSINSNLNDLKIVSATGEYYLMNNEGDLLKVPYSNEDYELNAKTINTPMSSEILYDVIKQSVKDEIKRKENNEDIQYGNSSIFELYYKFRN